LITGATGFTGSFLVEHYARHGWQVHGTYRDSGEDTSWLPSGVTLHQLDLRDQGLVFDLVRAVSPELVHHLAARSSVTDSLEDPLGTLHENAAAQYNVLEALLAFRRDARVVVVGSCDEYGRVTADENPIDEAQELRPGNPYALSKVVQDLMGGQYAEIHHLHVIRLRPFLQIGPRRPARFVAGSFARQLAEIEMGLREPAVHVGNLDLLRDFTDVRDVARAYALAAEYGSPGAVYNIASGKAWSLRELLSAMLSASSTQPAIVQDRVRIRQNEPPVLVGDASKLRALTGWEPTISFEQSASDTLDYWRSQVHQALAVERGRG
jgi:GDP-4-dehydro-6-deoxy-D-mannose reductase